MSEEKRYGARIERGILKEKSGEKFRVESICRPGVITPPLKPIPIPEEELPKPYAVGDRVYFFIFQDGGGAIIAPVEE